jgi:DNA-binding response OmpR family regulator
MCGRYSAGVTTGRTQVLVVEDEVDVAHLIKHTLERSGDVDVGIALTAEAALTKVKEATPDLIVLDLNLPGYDGLELCRILRSRPASATIPIVMVTARTTESDRIRGLELGADDYVTKPFSPRELAARVRAALRRSRAHANPTHTMYRGRRLVADFDAVAVSVDGTPVRLTRREFELLRYLIQNRNRVVSRDRLLERVWGYDHAIDTRSVDVHVGRLRGKLGASAAQIETVIGLGYRFVEDGGVLAGGDDR